MTRGLGRLYCLSLVSHKTELVFIRSTMQPCNLIFEARKTADSAYSDSTERGRKFSGNKITRLWWRRFPWRGISCRCISLPWLLWALRRTCQHSSAYATVSRCKARPVDRQTVSQTVRQSDSQTVRQRQRQRQTDRKILSYHWLSMLCFIRTKGYKDMSMSWQVPIRIMTGRSVRTL